MSPNEVQRRMRKKIVRRGDGEEKRRKKEKKRRGPKRGEVPGFGSPKEERERWGLSSMG